LNGHARGFPAAHAQTAVTAENFNRIAQRGDGQDADFFAFKQAEFEQPLQHGRVARNSLDDARLADPELIECGHEPTQSSPLRPDEDAHHVIAAQAQAAAAHLQHARAAWLEHLEATAVANAQFRHPADPARFALNVFDHGAFAAAEQFEG
jgi:hypothetical protein